MAAIGVVAAGLMGAILSGAFSRSGNSQSITQTTNLVTQSLGSVIQRAAQTTGQTVVVDQKIKATGANFDCPGGVTFENTNVTNATAIGNFDTRSAAEIQNAIINRIQDDIQNDANVRTSFLSSLPPNTSEVQMTRNITQIVRQVYSSENLNSMLQSIQVNQGIDLSGSTVRGLTCNIRNVTSANLLAQNSLQVLSEALLSNQITNDFISRVSQRYTGTAQGIFGPISDFLDMIRWVAIVIVIVIGIVLIVGIILKFALAKGSTTGAAAAGGMSLQQLLFLDALTSSNTTTAPVVETKAVTEVATTE